MSWGTAGGGLRGEHASMGSATLRTPRSLSTPSGMGGPNIAGRSGYGGKVTLSDCGVRMGKGREVSAQRQRGFVDREEPTHLDNELALYLKDQREQHRELRPER